MRLHIAKPGEHVALVDWPFAERLDDWTMPGLHEVVGLHRHVVGSSRAATRPTSSRSCPTTWPSASGGCSASWSVAGLPTAEVIGVVLERDSKPAWMAC